MNNFDLRIVLPELSIEIDKELKILSKLKPERINKKILTKEDPIWEDLKIKAEILSNNQEINEKIQILEN